MELSSPICLFYLKTGSSLSPSLVECRSEVSLASFMPKQKHLGKAGKCRTVPGQNPVMGKVVFAVTVPLITSSLTAFSLDHPEPSGTVEMYPVLACLVPQRHPWCLTTPCSPPPKANELQGSRKGLPMCPQCQVYICLIL